MKKLFVIISTVALFVLIGFSACGLLYHQEPDKIVFLRSYVMSYRDVVCIESEPISSIKEPTEKTGIRIYILPAQARNGVISAEESAKVHLGGYNDTGVLREAYDALCVKHNDMTFNRNVVTWREAVGPMFISGNIGVDFVSVDVVSDADFDDAHPAGKSLGDIVTFSGMSLKSYIDGGYGDSYSYNYTPVRSLLSKLTSDMLILLEDVADLMFESLPTLSKTHNFTVTMTADDGRVFSDTIEMTFE